MASLRACLIVLVVTLATAVVAAAGTAEMSEQRRRQVRNLLTRLNKEPLASIQVLFIVLWCCDPHTFYQNELLPK
jgi:hypothetical protein